MRIDTEGKLGYHYYFIYSRRGSIYWSAGLIGRSKEVLFCNEVRVTYL